LDIICQVTTKRATLTFHPTFRKLNAALVGDQKSRRSKGENVREMHVSWWTGGAAALQRNLHLFLLVLIYVTTMLKKKLHDSTPSYKLHQLPHNYLLFCHISLLGMSHGGKHKVYNVG